VQPISRSQKVARSSVAIAPSSRIKCSRPRASFRVLVGIVRIDDLRAVGKLEALL
jgi:hypothetical protein